MFDWHTIDYHEIRRHYDHRVRTHQLLLKYFHEKDMENYVNLALGIDDPAGNYSASDHGSGPEILRNKHTYELVFQLAEKLIACEEPSRIPDIIYSTNISGLKISIGSEMAALLRPELFWVVNTRTVWAHFVIKYDSVDQGNEVLKAFHENRPSNMDYYLWKDVCPDVGLSMASLATMATTICKETGIIQGELTYLWADAVADVAYNMYSK